MTTAEAQAMQKESETSKDKGNMKSAVNRLHSKLMDVPLSQIRVSDRAQRKLRPARVNYLQANFDPEQFGYPVMSFRDGAFYAVDGQHRVESVKGWLQGRGEDWASYTITCRVYYGMNEQQEADMFDKLNNALPVASFDKFGVRVTAERSEAVAVAQCVNDMGLKISLVASDESVMCVATLVRIYQRTDTVNFLGRSLLITHKSFGGPGLTAIVIDGIARVCERYGDGIDDNELITALQSLHGGVGALLSKAGLLKKQTGAASPVCVAAAVTEIYNGRAKGRKVASWWKVPRGSKKKKANNEAE